MLDSKLAEAGSPRLRASQALMQRIMMHCSRRKMHGRCADVAPVRWHTSREASRTQHDVTTFGLVAWCEGWLPV